MSLLGLWNTGSMRKGQATLIVAAKEQQPGTSLESKRPSSHDSQESAWEQEKQAALPTVLAASFQQLPRKHIKLISHAPDVPALSSPDEQETIAAVPAAKIPLAHSCPRANARHPEIMHPPHCSLHSSLKITALSSGFSKGVSAQ